MNGFAPTLLIARNLRQSKDVDHSLASSSAVYLKVLSLDRFCMYSTQHHWLTFYDSIKCNFTFTSMIVNVYISFSTNNDRELTNSITKIEECLPEIDEWMSINRLKLNKEKTELLYSFSKYNPYQSLPPLRFGTNIIKPSPHARNIGTIFDNTMSMNVCKSAFYHLRTISRIRKYLSTQTIEIRIQAFVTSKLDHCNYLLYNVPYYLPSKLCISNLQPTFKTLLINSNFFTLFSA